MKRIPVIHGRAEIARLNDVGCVKSTNCHPERSRGATIQPDLRRLLLPTAVGIAKTIPRRRSVRWGSRSITFYLFLFTYKPTPARVFSSPTPDEKNRDGKNTRPKSHPWQEGNRSGPPEDNARRVKMTALWRRALPSLLWREGLGMSGENGLMKRAR